MLQKYKQHRYDLLLLLLFQSKHSVLSCLRSIITHYQRLLNYIVPDVVHVMMGGKIVKTGGPELAKKLEDEGYAGLRDELGLDIKLTDENA